MPELSWIPAGTAAKEASVTGLGQGNNPVVAGIGNQHQSMPIHATRSIARGDSENWFLRRQFAQSA
jgi:hypothetical protein